LKICWRGRSMFWRAPPLKNVVLFYWNCCWITLQVSHHQVVKTYVTNGRQNYFSSVASPSRRDAGFTFRPNDGKNQSLYFINFITK